jgi:hypothetical protein
MLPLAAVAAEIDLRGLPRLFGRFHGFLDRAKAALDQAVQ